jgi:hypothetical protein
MQCAMGVLPLLLRQSHVMACRPPLLLGSVCARCCGCAIAMATS